MSDLLVWLLIGGVWFIGYLPTITRILFNACCEYLVACWITPTTHSMYGDYENTEASRSLSSEGYSITPKWSSSAISSIKKD